MFVKAIEEVAGFTRAIHTIFRNFGKEEIQRGSATLFFVNEDGWALTCRHVAQWIMQAEKINQNFQQFVRESPKLSGKQQNILAKNLGLTSDKICEMRVTFVDCLDQIQNIKFILHPTHDLALIKFDGFQRRMYQGNPRFLENHDDIKQGALQCRLGFPFPEFTNFRFNPQRQLLEWTAEGVRQSPRFPIEGMITRFLGDQSGEIYGIEISTPGLRGQSGGPLFDAQGRIIGIQSRTKHLHLGFDIEEKEIISHGKKKKINDYAFIHLGECVHVKVIKEFLDNHQVSYQTG